MVKSSSVIHMHIRQLLKNDKHIYVKDFLRITLINHTYVYQTASIHMSNSSQNFRNKLWLLKANQTLHQETPSYPKLTKYTYIKEIYLYKKEEEKHIHIHM